MQTLVSAHPRPNHRKLHPLDECQRLHPCHHPVEEWERAGFQDDEPPRTDWFRVWSWLAAVLVTLACWFLLFRMAAFLVSLACSILRCWVVA